MAFPVPVFLSAELAYGLTSTELGCGHAARAAFDASFRGTMSTFSFFIKVHSRLMYKPVSSSDLHLHLIKCRPVGLLLLLLKLYGAVHFETDSAIKAQLMNYRQCRSLDIDAGRWCSKIASDSWHNEQAPVVLDRSVGARPTSDSSDVPWTLGANASGFGLERGRKTAFPKHWFLSVEYQIWTAIQEKLGVSAPNAALAFPRAADVVCGPPCELLGSERKVFSQVGDDGILEAIFRCIGVTSRTYLEIGTQDGRQCNTRYLRVAGDFHGHMIDDTFEDSRINLTRRRVTPEIGRAVLNETIGHAAFRHLDLVSIDTDGMDFVIWGSLCGAVRPRVLVLEVGHCENTEWPDRNRFCPSRSCSLAAINWQAKRCGFVLVYAGFPNAFFVRSDVFRAARGCRLFRDPSEVPHLYKGRICQV